MLSAGVAFAQVEADEMTGADMGAAADSFPAPMRKQDAARALAATHCRLLVGYTDGALSPDFSLLLGSGGNRLSLDERKQFDAAITRHLRAQWQLSSAQHLACELHKVESNAGLDENMLPVQSHERYVQARLISSTGAPLNLVYHVTRQVRASGWSITNISVNGRPLVENYRASISKALREGGLARLLQALDGH